MSEMRSEIQSIRTAYFLQFLTFTAVMLPWVFVAPILQKMGASKFFIGLAGGLYSSSYLISSAISGRIADEKGANLVIKIGLAASAITFFLQYFASDAISFILVRALSGFAVGMYPGAIVAVAYYLGIKIGRLSAAGSTGWTVGSVLSSIVAFFISEKFTFVVSSLVFLIAFILSTRCQFKGTKVPRVNMKEVFKRNREVYLTMLLRHTGANTIWMFWVPFLMSLHSPSYLPPALMAINTVSQIVFMYFITDIKSPKSLILMGILASSITFYGYSLINYYLWIIPLQILLGISWAFLYVGSARYLVENNKERATAMGLLNSTIGTAAVIGPLLGGIILQLTGSYKSLMYTALILTILSLIFYGLFCRKCKMRN